MRYVLEDLLALFGSVPAMERFWDTFKSFPKRSKQLLKKTKAKRW